MKLDGAQINQTTLRIAQDWKHLLGGQKVVGEIEADKGREKVLGIKRSVSSDTILCGVSKAWTPKLVSDGMCGEESRYME
ncbi:hypothetical protein Tco_0781124 [Tanacetum coccineum]